MGLRRTFRESLAVVLVGIAGLVVWMLGLAAIVLVGIALAGGLRNDNDSASPPASAAPLTPEEKAAEQESYEEWLGECEPSMYYGGRGGC